MQALLTFNKMVVYLTILAMVLLNLVHGLVLDERCVDTKGSAGTCVFIQECQSMAIALRERPLNQEVVKMVQQNRCGSKNSKAMVCCAGVDIASRSSVKATLPRPPQCGQHLSDRIVGGQETDLDQYPWAALIQYRKPNQALGFHCGGSLINSRYIVTAAHCINAIPNGWQVVGVRLGEHNTTNNGQDCVDNACADFTADMEIAKIIVHENYNPDSRTQYDDIALIKFTRDAVYSPFVKPVCLPIESSVRNANHAGTKAVAAGWGRTETASSSPVKLKVNLDINDINQCASVYRSAGVPLRNTQMCAGGKKGQDTCTGDSGGPLMREIDAKFYLVGIVSFGPNKCGTDRVSGVYTDVAKYIDWIDSHME